MAEQTITPTETSDDTAQEIIEPVLLVMVLAEEIATYQDAARAAHKAKQAVEASQSKLTEATKAEITAKKRVADARAKHKKLSKAAELAKEGLLESFHDLIVPNEVTDDSFDIDTEHKPGNITIKPDNDFWDKIRDCNPQDQPYRPYHYPPTIRWESEIIQPSDTNRRWTLNGAGNHNQLIAGNGHEFPMSAGEHNGTYHALPSIALNAQALHRKLTSKFEADINTQ